MAGGKYNEARAIRQFEGYDEDFASWRQGRRERIISRLENPDEDDRVLRVSGQLPFEAGNYRKRFALSVMSGGQWDLAALDASQRIRHTAFEMEQILVVRDDIMPPSTWGFGEHLLELLGTGRESLATRMSAMGLQLLTGQFWTPTEEKRNGFSSDQKLLVFALEMLAATRNETIDWDSYKIPTDRFWLECARTGLTESNTEKCAQWMRDLCEAHTTAANVAADSGETDTFDGHEIDDPTHFLWPITVHAFIKLRRGLGLPIPEEVDHPLMRTSFAPFAERVFDEKLWAPEPWFVEIFEIAEGLEPELTQVRELVL